MNVLGVDGAASADATVVVQTIDGQLTNAASNGIVYAAKNVGQKLTIDVSHPQYGSAKIEAVLPMVDPIFVEIHFTGLNRAYLSQSNAVELGAIAQRAPGNWQVPAAAEGGASTCASCTPIGDGVVAGDTCDGGSEADNTSCTFSDTVTDWYCYTASGTGTAMATTCGSGYDTALSVWDACGGTQLACNDDACGLQSTVTWAATSGTTYYVRVSGFNNACGSYTLDVSTEGGGGGGGCGDCNLPNPNGLPGCSDQACQDIVCAADPFCCDTAWDGICAGEADDLCNCSGPGCQSDDDCPPGQVCIGGNCVAPPCIIDCPAGALEEGEPCGADNNGGCNSAPVAFTDAACGDTFCGNSWADGGTRDTDWYLVEHGGGVISATLNSQFSGVCFIVSGIPACAPAVEGDIGCANDCGPIADASADLPAGQYVVFVAPGDCAGGGIFEGIPCGSGDNDYTVTISCAQAVTGACCLPDNSCVDGVSQEECEAPPAPPGGCGDCNQPDPAGAPGCSDAACQAIVCAADPFCCDVAWDGICAGEADDLCNCSGGGGGLGGVYQGDDSVCNGPTCIPVGGCCQCDGDNLPFCTTESADDCDALGGQYLGDGASCDAGGGQVEYSSNPNAAIPDNNVFGVSDTINVGDSFTVLDLQVDVNITHTWVGDLCVTLSKDAGPEVVLIQRMADAVLGCDGGCCGCSANNLNVTLDDAAASSIDDQCVDNLVGTFSPDPGSLAGYVGGGSAGAWTIRVADNAGADLGVLVSWALVMTQPASGDTPCEAAGHSCNEAPDCSGAVASDGELWPPNHSWHNISIDGVTDPDGDDVTITITGIFQDELQNGQGDGNTCPDGSGVGGSTAQVRAERSGQGNGRVYHIFFTADDGQGGECDGSVTVCVPHDQGQGSECVDGGPLYDSTDCSGAGGNNVQPGFFSAPASVGPLQ